MLYCLRLSEYIYLVENKKVVEILKEVRNSRECLESLYTNLLHASVPLKSVILLQE